jgi:alpha-L-rhamnosidase
MKMLSTILIGLFMMLPGYVAANTNAALDPPFDLRCDYLVNPLGIENEHPSLSWKNDAQKRAQVQSAYQIVAASSADKLQSGTFDFWDTGKVSSDQQVHVSYAGKSLHSGDQLFWSVRVWDGNGRPTDWSELALWEMALLKSSDWKAKWIGDGVKDDPNSFKTGPAPYFRKEFKARSDIAAARVYISGLGYYELSLNGAKVGDLALAPSQTNYDKRELKKLLYDYDDQSTTRVLYNTFDITDNLKEGQNAVGVILGHGWYNQRDRRAEGWMWYDTPRMIAQIHIKYADGSSEWINSDDSWNVSTGSILYNGIFTGEHVDARLEKSGWNLPGFDDSSWKKAAVVRAPTGRLQAQLNPPDRVIKSMKLVTLEKIKPGVYLADVGQMISGWIKLRVSGKSGDEIRLRHIEELGNDYNQIDVFTLSGNGVEIFEPRFTWHAFRHVEISGITGELSIDDITVQVVNTDVDTVGSFTCSNDLFNQIYKNYIWTQLGNLHGSFSSDCPHRERLGYTGDGTYLVESSIFSFDMFQSYKKWLDDIDDARNKVTGFVPHTAPFGGGGGGPAWGSAYVIVPWLNYLYYGDKSLLKQHYDGMKQWADYLGTRTDSTGRVVREEPNGWCLGDWATPLPIKIPEPLVNTCYYFYVSDLVSKIAAVLENDKDAAFYANVARDAKSALNEYYFDKENKRYWTSEQGADVYPLAFGMVASEHRDQVLESLTTHLQSLDVHFDTGILATPLLLDVLTQEGREDLAFMLMNQRDFPSFGDYIINKGATALWEYFDGSNSHSHPMYGSVCRWFYKALAGINPDEKSPGMQDIILKPVMCGDLDFVKADYTSFYGDIKSEWKIEDNNLEMILSIPANTSATVFVPALKKEWVTESGKKPENQAGIKFLRMEKSAAVYKIGSGSYGFASRNMTSLIKPVALPAPVMKPLGTLHYKPETLELQLIAPLPGAEIYYTTDGSIPTQNSTHYTAPVKLTDSAVVQAIAVKDGFEPSHISKEFVRFVDRAQNGFKYTVFEGEWTERPNRETITAVSSGTVFNYDVNKIKRRGDMVAILYEGFLDITVKGEYTFYAKANNGCVLNIDGEDIVDNGGYSGDLETEGVCVLATGRHPISIFYFENEGSERMDLEIQGPGLAKQTLPEQMIFMRDK